MYFVIPNTNPLTSNGEIDEYNVVTQTSRTLVPNISGTPWDIAVSGSNLLVTLRDGNAIGEYDATTGRTVNATLVTGLNWPYGITVTPGDGTTFCTPPPSNMVAWYSFDQNLPSDAQYDLANGNDATIHGTQSVGRAKYQMRCTSMEPVTRMHRTSHG